MEPVEKGRWPFPTEGLQPAAAHELSVCNGQLARLQGETLRGFFNKPGWSIVPQAGWESKENFHTREGKGEKAADVSYFSPSTRLFWAK
jgi:hypothetical protein